MSQASQLQILTDLTNLKARVRELEDAMTRVWQRLNPPAPVLVQHDANTVEWVAPAKEKCDCNGWTLGPCHQPAPAKECIDGPNPTQRCSCDRGPAHAEGDGCARSCEAHAPPEAGKRWTHSPTCEHVVPAFDLEKLTAELDAALLRLEGEQIECVNALEERDALRDTLKEAELRLEKRAEAYCHELDRRKAAEAREKGLRDLLTTLKTEGILDWNMTNQWERDLKEKVEAALAEKEKE